MADFILGMNAKLYIGAADAALESMAVIGNVKNLTLALEAAEADISTRENQGWRAMAATLKSASATFQMIWKPGDANFDLIKAAFLSSGTVAMAVLDDLYTAENSDGPVGNWAISNFSRNEELEDAIRVDVTAKLSKYHHWHTGAACADDTEPV